MQSVKVSGTIKAYDAKQMQLLDDKTKVIKTNIYALFTWNRKYSVINRDSLLKMILNVHLIN